MKKSILLILLGLSALFMASCDADEEEYNSFIGDWHLVMINAKGEYRKPIPNADSCFNIHFLQNNSMIGESVTSTFASVYNVRKKNKIVWSGFTYVPVSEDSTDNIVFMEDFLKVDRYEMRGDTLKFIFDGKTYLTFKRW